MITVKITTQQAKKLANLHDFLTKAQNKKQKLFPVKFTLKRSVFPEKDTFQKLINI